jgi:hypothetical protein
LNESHTATVHIEGQGDDREFVALCPTCGQIAREVYQVDAEARADHHRLTH